MTNKISAPYPIKTVAIILFIVGALGLFVVAAIAYAPVKTYFGGYINVYGLSVPEAIYSVFIGILLVIAGLNILAGYLLLKLKKSGFWLGAVLSVFMVLSFPIGTILAVVNLYLLIKNKSVFG